MIEIKVGHRFKCWRKNLGSYIYLVVEAVDGPAGNELRLGWTVDAGASGSGHGPMSWGLEMVESGQWDPDPGNR